MPAGLQDEVHLIHPCLQSSLISRFLVKKISKNYGLRYDGPREIFTKEKIGFKVPWPEFLDPFQRYVYDTFPS